MRQGWQSKDGTRFDCTECLEDDQQEERGCPLAMGRGPFPPASEPVHVEMEPVLGADGRRAGEREVAGTATFQCPQGLAALAQPTVDTLTFLHDFGMPPGMDWRDAPYRVLMAYRTARWGLFPG